MGVRTVIRVKIALDKVAVRIRVTRLGLGIGFQGLGLVF